MGDAASEGAAGVLEQLAPGGALVALVAAAVLAIWRGWLVPKRTLDELLRVQSERLAESLIRENEWRANWLTEKARGDLQADQIGDLLELAKVWDPLIRQWAEPIRRSGGKAG